jgi:hypothetical protein
MRCSLSRSVIVALYLGAAACQNYPFVYQTNQRVGGRAYNVEVKTEGKTDILFVIDNSGSMAKKQQQLKDNMAAFIRVLAGSVDDYQVGIVSTDLSRVPSASGCDPCCDLDTDGDQIPDWSDCDAGRLVAADGRSRFFRRPKSDDPTLLPAMLQKLIDGFNANVTSLGTQGSAYETAFEAVRRALDPDAPYAVHALNYGFLRPEADLAIIFLTDEDDCSYAPQWYTPGRDDAECYYNEHEATPVGDYIDFLVALKGDIKRVRAAGIIGSVPSSDLARSLGQAAAGCYTVNDPGGPHDGQPSSECGCWSVRHLPDRRPGRDVAQDFYCDYLADPPFSQLATRSPDLGNDQGGCLAMPGQRYLYFLEELARRRVAAGLQPGVMADSICRPDFRVTLEQIALAVVLSNCFQLKEVPKALDQIVLMRNGEVLPRVEAGSKTAGWSYDPSTNGICLEGGVTKKVGDVFEISAVNETTGF